MYYKIGSKVIIDDKKIIEEYQDGIKTVKDAEMKKSLQKELGKFRRYMKQQTEKKKPFIIKDMMWESPETLRMYYLIGHWYMKEDNIIGIAK